ncbi:MAG: L-threonylcarbamoyladenylate synthase [Desulfovibrionaceae bacterium]
MAILRSGGVVVYPTETLYAVGCNGLCAEAALRVAAIKGRPQAKPLPLIIGDFDLLGQVTRDVPELARRLAADFWPGPLSLLVEARPEIPCPVKDASGMVSVRHTPHPSAARLSVEMGAPLVATSANLSGCPAVALPAELDPVLLARVDRALLDPPYPSGGPPSTLVRLLPDGSLEVLREGAVTRAALLKRGYACDAVAR